MTFQPADIKKPKAYQPYVYDPEPKEWAALDAFPKAKKLIVEVGCGKGHWVLKESKENPEKFYIGIERTINKSKTFLREADVSQLTNLISIQADAIPLIHQKFPKSSIDELYFFYPNPTPKKRQANQRFFVSPSFEVFDKALKKEGLLYCVTNIEDYLIEAKTFLETFWGYTTIKHSQITDKSIKRTMFEKKYQEAGEKIFELLVKK